MPGRLKSYIGLPCCNAVLLPSYCKTLLQNCMFCKFTCTRVQHCARMRILSGWSEWAFITPRPLKNKLELPFDDGQDEENGLNRIVLMTHILQFLVKSIIYIGIAQEFVIKTMMIYMMTHIV